MRLLHAARLSRMGDAATGLDKQDESARRYAEVHGHEIVATAADTDVSGSIAPKARPQLGPWLTDPEKVAQYDEIVAAYLDRLGRNARQLAELRGWAEDNGKRITVIEPTLHWPPGPKDFASPIVWDVLGHLAEYELRAITERNRETMAWLSRNDYLVGRPPFGYRIVPKGEHKTLEPDPALVPYLRGMVDRAIAGDSLTSICEWLDAESVEPVHGGRWSITSVSQTLRNPILYGRRKNARGQTVLRVDPVIDHVTWKRLQDAVDAKSRPRGAVSSDPALLTGVVYCDKCKGVMHRRVVTGPPRKTDGVRLKHRYYRCDGKVRQPSKCRNTVPMTDLDEWVDGWFSPDAPLGRLPLVERVTIPGDGHEHEIEQVGQDMQELTAQYAADAIDDATYDDAMSKLRAERTRLRELPAEPDRVEDRPTGRTVAEHWRELDTAGRRAFMLDAGLRVYVEKREPRFLAKLVPTDTEAFESTFRYARRGVKVAEPWQRKGAALVIPTTP